MSTSSSPWQYIEVSGWPHAPNALVSWKEPMVPIE